MGELEFRILRQEAEDQLGDLFDLKEFHYTVLEAYGPLSTVKKEVRRWIQNTLKRT